MLRPPTFDPPTPGGRTYAARRRVRMSDITPGDRLRFDAIARYLQDIARDDAADAGLGNVRAWLARRAELVLLATPHVEDLVEVTTWCAAAGAAHAERRTRVCRGDDVCVEAATIWVQFDIGRGRPQRLGADFAATYGIAAAGRKADAHLRHAEAAPPEATVCHWPLRAADLDVFDHLNNAAALAPVEETLAELGAPADRVLWCSIEYRDPIEPGAPLSWCVAARSDGFDGWLGPQGSPRAAVTVEVRW